MLPVIPEGRGIYGVKKGCKVTVLAKDKATYNKAVKKLKKGGLTKAEFVFKKKK